MTVLIARALWKKRKDEKEASGIRGSTENQDSRNDMNHDEIVRD